MNTETPAQRFWAKVEKTATCWLWTAAKYRNGYGQFDHGGAHRFSYALANGEIPAGLVIDHLCCRRDCVRPDHLEAVAQATNVIRGYGPPVAAARMAAWSQSRTECKRGHPLTAENTYVTPSEGWRQCRACKRLANHRRRAKRVIVNLES